MANQFRTCEDRHRCENGALCVEAQEGSFYCDCDTANGGDFAGLSCEFSADTYCRRPQDATSSWFCTNQGTCVMASGETTGWKCDCPAEYDGSHCEYIAGALPDDWPSQNQVMSSSRGSTADGGSDGLETGVMVAIIAVSALVAAMLGFLVVRSVRRRRQDEGGDELVKDPSSTSFKRAGQNAAKDQSEALNIDMDGTGFRDSVLTSGKSNGTEPFDFDSAGVSVEVDSEVGSPQMATNANTYAPKANGSGRSNGHGMML